MSNDNVTDLTKYLPDAPTTEAEVEEMEEFTIEEVLTGFAQGLEILRLGILDLDSRVTDLDDRLVQVEDYFYNLPRDRDEDGEVKIVATEG